MNRAFIQQVFDRVAAELPQIKKFGLYNNQFDNYNDGTEKAINYPAMFLSFPEPIEYGATGGGNQKTNEFILRFYIGYKLVNDKMILNAFDLKQEVFNIFHQWKPDGATSLTRVSELPDESREGYYIFIQDYSLSLTDSEKWFENSRTAVTLSNLVVNGDITPSI